jgi:uncharacterized protein (DUF2141 family)
MHASPFRQRHLAVALAGAVAAVALLSFATIAHAETCATVEVQNLRPGQGPLMIAAYLDAASFRKISASEKEVKVTIETQEVQLCGLNGESVAIALYQDINGNGKLDTNLLGIPSEPWSSSGKFSALSAPTWETARVPLVADKIVIKLPK